MNAEKGGKGAESALRRVLRPFIKKQNETLDIDVLDVRLFDLPDALDGFRIAVLSDLHMLRAGGFYDRVLEAVYREKPGCVLVAGDTADRRTESVEALEPFFYYLSRIAPCVAVLGNNDCAMYRTAALRSMYAAAGVQLLENESRLLNARGAPVRITGLTDPLSIRLGVHTERPQPEKPVNMPLAEALRPEPIPSPEAAPQGKAAPEAPPSVLLMHQPQFAGRYASLAPSLIVAGHAHGGLFRAPLLGGLYAPGQGVFPRYTSGLYRIGKAWMVVSRGIGNHVFPVRLNNRPHLPVAVLRKGGTSGAG